MELPQLVIDQATLLGQGSFGSVYRVIVAGQVYALKVAVLVKGPALTTLINETRILVRLTEADCPGVPKFYGAYRVTFQDGPVNDWVDGSTISTVELIDQPIDQPIPYLQDRQDRQDRQETYYGLLMEYIPGVSLARLAMSPSLIIWILASLCRTVACLHRYGIVHKDIKPDNIILRNNRELYLVDYGVACLVDEPKARAPIGRRTTLSCSQYAGTITTMAPELQQHRKIDDPMALDVWSIGATIYELLYRRALPQEVRLGQVEQVVLPDDQPILGPILLAMLNLNPAQRPTAQQVLDWIDSIEP